MVATGLRDSIAMVLDHNQIIVHSCIRNIGIKHKLIIWTVTEHNRIVKALNCLQQIILDNCFAQNPNGIRSEF